MFRTSTTITNASTHASAKRPAFRRLIALGAPLAFLGLGASAVQADPWFRISFGDHGWGRGHREPVCRPPVVIGPEIRIERRPVEVVPCDLRFTAYQTGNTVLIFVSGENRSAGFTTCLAACDDGWAPTVTLRNTAPLDNCGAQVITRFEVSGSFEARHCLQRISVRVAGQCFEVPVSQVQRLS